MTDYLRLAQESAPAQATESDNRYLDLARQQQREEQGRARLALEHALRDSPDLAAERLRISKASGVPLRVVERNLDELRVKEQARQVDLVRMAKDSPVLARQLLDPTFTTTSVDDLDTLGNLEKAIRRGVRYVTGAGDESLAVDAVGAAKSVVLGGTVGVGAGLFDLAGVINDAIGWDSGAAGARNQAKRARESMEAYGLQATTDTGKAVKAGLESAGMNLALLPLGLANNLWRSATAAGTAVAGAMSTLVGAQSYSRGREEGLGKLQAASYGLTDAGFEFLMERIPASRLFGDLATNAGFLKTLGHQMVSEGWTEQVTTIAQDFNEWMNLNPDKSLSEFIAERPEAAYQTLIATLVGTGVQTTTITAINKAVEKIANDRTTYELDLLQEQLRLATGSALRERSPEQFRALVQEIASNSDGAKKEVYVDGQVLNQLPDDLKAQLPAEVREQIEGAAATNSPVPIAIADVLTIAPGTALEQVINDNARMTPDGLSRVEAQQKAEQSQEFIKAEAERIAQQAADSEAWAADAEQVRQSMIDQLNATGRFNADVNEAYATLIRDFFAVMANRLGTTPLELYQRYPLKAAAKIPGQRQENLGKEPARPGAISVEGYHFSKQDRPLLSTSFFGTGLQGSARDEIMNSPDARLRERLSFYFDKGTGIRPESGVGGRAHRVQLDNVYDADADPLKLRTGDARAFESKLLDLGYSGYATRLEGTQPGQVIMLGRQTFKPELLGAQSQIQAGQKLEPIKAEPQWQTQAAGAPEQLRARLERMRANPAWAGYDLRIEGNELQVRPKSEVLEQRGVQPAGRTVPASVDAIANVEAAFEFAATQSFPTNRDFKLAIQSRVQAAAKAAKVKLDEFSAATEDYLVRIALADGRTALRTNANAVGWYNEKVTKALRLVSLIHPEIATEPQAKFAFVWAMAVTSNGLKVDKNFELAEQVYRGFKAAGQMPTDIGIGTAAAAINRGLGLYNTLIAKHGFETVERFMTTMQTVKDVEAFTGMKVSGENLTTQVYGAAALGPKIGNGFFMNLYGRFEQLTMDRWLMRTWGRWTGTLVEENPAQVRAKRTLIKGLIQSLSPADKKAFETIIKRKLTVGDIDDVAAAIWKASQKPANRAAMAAIGALDAAGSARTNELLGEPKKGVERVSFGDELRKAGNALTKYLDGQKEAPAGPPERGSIRKVFSRALAELQKEFPALTMADFQALLWYPEKRLYDAAKTQDEATDGYEDDEAPDYANAAAKLARAQGVSDADIRAAVAAVDAELSAADRAAGARPGERGAQSDLLAQGGLSDGQQQAGDGAGRYSSGSLAPLEGAPTVQGATGPDPRLVAVAEQYALENGIDLRRQGAYVKVDPARAARIAAAYEAMEDAPNDPAVRDAYENLIQQTLAQYLALQRAGYVFTFFDDSTDPYQGNPWNAMRDLRANQRMAVYGTYAGYGTGSELNVGLADPKGGPNLDPETVLTAIRAAGGDVSASTVHTSDTEPTLVVTLARALDDDAAFRLSEALGQEAIAQRFADGSGKLHGPNAAAWGEFNPEFFLTPDGRRASEAAKPLLADTGLEWPDQNGAMHPVLANDLFRAVHDAFGYGLEGAGFRADGEENAWQAHARLFTGSALGALTSETRGQNSWLNYGPHGEANRTAKVEDTIFADQKTGLMPEWTWTEGRAPDMEQGGVFNQGAVPLLAPNGEPSNLSPAQYAMVRTPAFKAWFGDWENDPANASKAVDENGEPKVFYHGSTKAGFTEFDTDGEGKTRGTGAFFADSFSMARGYSGTRDDARAYTPEQLFADPDLVDGLSIEQNGVAVEVVVNSRGGKAWQWYASAEEALAELELDPGEELVTEPGYLMFTPEGYEVAGTKADILDELKTLRVSAPGVYSVFLNVRDLVTIDWQGKNWDEGPTEKTWRVLDEDGDTYETAYSEEERDAILADNPGFTAEEEDLAQYDSTDDAARQVRGMGADGVLIRNVGDTGPEGYAEDGDVLVVYAPENIKSATGNRGTFDPDSASILEQRAYHGSPHRGIDKFSTDKIGTGEGAQVFGWGLYFTNAKDIAEYYRTDLARRHAAASPAYKAAEQELWDAMMDVDMLGFDTQAEALRALRKEPEAFDVTPEQRQRIDAALTARDRLWEEMTKGQLYEVEIPEDDELLLWDKPIGKQPEKVRAALEALGFPTKEVWVSYDDANGDTVLREFKSRDEARRFVKDNNLKATIKTYDSEKSGERVYELLSKQMGGDREASLALLEAGVKGTNYPAGSLSGGKSNSRNFVIFSDDDVAIQQQFYQEPAKREPLGTYHTPTLTISLLEKANLSTFLHETGHFFLEVMADIASAPDAPVQVRDDMAAVLKWFGVDSLDAWRALDLEGKRPHHERFAESFEQYLFEGKTPNPELKPLFRRFRSWLVNVYKSLTHFLRGRDLKLTDEVRQVFDRLLATDEQIAQAEEMSGLLPDADASAEAAEKLQARSMRDLKLTLRAHSEALKALTAEARRLRMAVEDEVRAEVMATPEMRAKTALDEISKPDPAYKEALAAWKTERQQVLDQAKADITEALVATEGDNVKGLQRGTFVSKNRRRIANEAEARALAWERANPKPTRPVSTDEAAVALIADQAGFASVDEMLQAIDAFGRPADAIEALTDQRMLERFGELATPEAVNLAAMDAVHNDARARALATELKAQADALGERRDTGTTNARGAKVTVNVLTEAAKDFAAALVARRRVKDLKAAAQQHRAAEARAGKAWQAATAKARTQEAIQAKRDQVLNHAAVRAFLDAQAEVKKMLEFFQRVTKGGNEKLVERGRDPDVVNAMRAILAAYDVAPRLEKGALEYLAIVERSDPAMFAALQPSVQAAVDAARPLTDLTIEELRGLHDELQAMWHLAKRSRQMEVDGNLLDIEDAADELVSRLDTIGIPAVVPGERSAITEKQEAGIKLQFAKAILSRVEQWAERLDGKFGGPFLRLVFQPIKDAADRYRTARADYRKRFTALVENIATQMPPGTIAAPELNYTFGGGRDSGTAELLHAILHTGNDSNKRKLLLGRKWAVENPDGTLDTTKWDAFIDRLSKTGVLKPEHFEFAQGVWDLLEEMKPLAQETHRRVFGRYFAEVTANSFVDPFGVTRRGGYVPAQTDSRLVKDAKLRELAEGENESMAYAFPSSPSGFTKARVEYNKPLLLDLRALAQHMDKVLLFSHMQGAVVDVRRLLTNKRVSYALDRVDPAAYEGMLIPWLNRAAKQIVETPVAGDRRISRLLSAARSRAGMALMFANVSNTLQQVTGFSSALVKVGPGALIEAAAKFTASPKEVKTAVATASEYMRSRMLNEVAAMADAVDQVLTNPTLVERGQDWTNRHAYFMQAAVDNTMSPIIWTAAYNQATAQKQSHDDAVRFADGVIRQTQGSTLPEDISRFESGPAYARLFTQFVGYFNMLANTNATAMKQVVDDVGVRRGAGRLFYIALVGVLTPIWVAEVIAQAFRGGPEDKEHDGYLDDWLAAVFGWGTLRGMAAQVPLVGQALQLVANRFNDNPADDKFSLSPAVSLIESSVSAPASVYKAIAEDGSAAKAARDLAAAATLLTGFPIYGAMRPAFYGIGVAEGKVEPTGPVDAVRGAITGTASPESKQR